MNEIVRNHRPLLDRVNALKGDDPELAELLDGLIEKAELLDAVLANLSICVSRIDADGSFTLSLGSGLQKFGLADNALVGVNVFEAYAHVADAVQRALDGGSVQFIDSGEHQGSPWAFQNWVFFDKYRQRGMFNIAMDITDIKETQKELARANEELTQFNYRTSHDLIAPLKTIQGYCELIQDDLKDGKHDDLEDYNQRIMKDVARLQGLVKDILRLTRADYLREDAVEVDFPSILGTIKDSLGYMIDKSSVAIETDFAHSRPLFSSATRVSQMLENLISNSIKYADRDSDRRFVRIRTFQDDDDTFVIAVSDNGIGVPESYRERVFDMFFRAHADTSAGSGLGLYLIKKHVEHMNGTVELTSGSEGTTVTLRLPNRRTP